MAKKPGKDPNSGRSENERQFSRISNPFLNYVRDLRRVLADQQQTITVKKANCQVKRKLNTQVSDRTW